MQVAYYKNRIDLFHFTLPYYTTFSAKVIRKLLKAYWAFVNLLLNKNLGPAKNIILQVCGSTCQESFLLKNHKK